MWGWLHLHHIGVSLNGGRGLDRLVKLVYDSLVTPAPRYEFHRSANNLWFYIVGPEYSIRRGPDTHDVTEYTNPKGGLGGHVGTRIHIPMWWSYTL